ncbi:QueD [Alteromonas phage vB_AcoS-R7M]|uniref:QueD n=1 Tax=Alteromonas phage vB_AcoS-R7M TaxID=2729541 RepID=A0A6M3YN76_9CAUD|nr:QueD-like 6-pyruvoyl-tetrahydropterin synthase [Alteromonas phage vB_AcoS-R7M]QJI53369.1 QueD [Alteromonas phage vB_AcoS-R7M]
MHKSTKTFGHNLGLSCAFRQWRATHSHCSKLHGYAIAVRLLFEAVELDERNWVMDFGALDEVKEFLKNHFDHKTLVAYDDPDMDILEQLDLRGTIDMVKVEAVGCEQFAILIHGFVTRWLQVNNHFPRVALRSVEVMEHGANSAIYEV